MHRTKTTHIQYHLQQLREQFGHRASNPLGEVLPQDELSQIVADETASYRERVYPPMVTLRLFIDQILSADQACQAAVTQQLVTRLEQGKAPCSANTGPYCKARQRLTLGLPQRLCKHLGARLESDAVSRWGWQGRSVKIFDATMVSMPDTPANQRAWPQSGRQKTGLGFPMARIGALISLSSGAVIDYAMGAMSGKGSGEQALLRDIAASLCKDDLLLADALHSTWWTVQMCMQRGVDVVMPNDGRRTVNFGEGCVLGPSDHVVWWPKPKQTNWMSCTQYEQLPEGIWVREIGVNGRILVTTMLNAAQASGAQLEALYARRWSIEVDFRTLKATMNMDVLRCKSPCMVRKEVAVYLLTSNLVRKAMAVAAQGANIPATRLSFASTRRLILAFARTPRGGPEGGKRCLASILHKHIATCLLPWRPGRIEPRAKKRRPKPLPLLVEPRQAARERIRAQRT